MPSSRAASPSTPALRPLALEALVPHHLSTHGHIAAALQRVDAVRVVRNPDRKSSAKFLVQVFSSRMHRRIPIATARSSVGALSAASTAATSSHTPRESASAVAKSLGDFADLRSRLYNAARFSHSRSYCDFCRGVVEYAFWGNPQPGTLAQLFRDDGEMLQSLTKFMGDLVSMVEAGCSAPTSGGRCCAYAKVSNVIHEFLFGPNVPAAATGNDMASRT